MKNLFRGFVVWLLIAWWFWVWRFYQEPIDVTSDVDNLSRQESVTTLAPLLPTFIARWTEPFWTIELTWGNLVWQAPWISGIDMLTYTWITQFNSWSIYIITNWANTVMVTLQPNACNDWMSETPYSWTAQILFATWPNLPVYTWCAIW